MSHEQSKTLNSETKTINKKNVFVAHFFLCFVIILVDLLHRLVTSVINILTFLFAFLLSTIRCCSAHIIGIFCIVEWPYRIHCLTLQRPYLLPKSVSRASTDELKVERTALTSSTFASCLHARVVR